MRIIINFCISVAFWISGNTLLANDPNFGNQQDRGEAQYAPITEASGIAASQRNNGVLWVHNDSGDLNRLYAMNEQGNHLGVYTINGVSARDWEDIAVGPGPETGISYLYIADIGDNSGQYPVKFIYRLPEPIVNPNQMPIDTVLTNVQTIAFQYSDGSRDAEALMVDPLTRDLYVVSKREANVHVYQAAYPQSTSDIITLPKIATLNMAFVTAADISPNGLELLIKNYNQVNYWCRDAQTSIVDALANNPVTVPYVIEPQGEAISWDRDGSGYFTISEEANNTPAHLYYYPRIPTGLKPERTDIVSFELAQNYPNPFNPQTTVTYVLPQAGTVVLEIYDAVGAIIRKMVAGRQPAGTHQINWNGKDEFGNIVSSGVYYYRLQVNDTFQVKKMTLVR